YPAESGAVHALRDVTLQFRESEFVAILGPSGCGKTTMLNILGGLDRYTGGELYIRHVPTAKYSDRDWDTYRNHSIGFVFQSYNLIPHQSVLANVELALTLSGVSKAERRRRAEEALTAVGLADQMKKRPSQMSGGQMQRVAIARALVNDPDILLADEPTGALDSETSVQIMEILREVAKTRLIIMVTHNPELAEEYSSRIIRVLDGRVLSDSNPYDEADEMAETFEEPAEETGKPVKSAKKRTSMSFPTALGLSLNNLMTKKTRTFLTAFAGSIGIIGIALILSLSHGISLYIDKIQEDTLSAYPIQINRTTVDMSSVMTAMMDVQASEKEDPVDDGSVHSNVMMYDLMDTMMSVDVQENNLDRFIEHLKNSEGGNIGGNVSAVAYGYDLPLNLYSVDDRDENGMPVSLDPAEMFGAMMQGGDSSSAGGMMSTGLTIWQEMIDNPDLMAQQYDVIAGQWPEAWNEVVLVVDEHYRVNDVFLYALGFKDPDELEEMLKAVMRGEHFDAESESWTYEEILGREFALVLPADLYSRNADGNWDYMGDSASYMQLAVEKADKLKITGIIRPNPEAVATSLTGAIGYLPALSEYVMEQTAAEQVVIDQLASETKDVFNGLEFESEDNSPDKLTDREKAHYIRSNFENMSAADRAAAYTNSVSAMPEEDAVKQAQEQLAVMPQDAVQQMLLTAMAAQANMDASNPEDAAVLTDYLAKMEPGEVQEMALMMMTEQIKQTYAAGIEAQLGAMTTDQLSAALDTALDSMSDEQIASAFADYMPNLISDSTYERNLRKLGWRDPAEPSFIKIYAETFEAKDAISSFISDYNADAAQDGREEDVINYTDYVALMMSSISTIINVISYVLIAFVSISLVVSSIMIGIITYISVLERTKEIGILRAVGASKKDISRVFNAETLIVGFTSGAIGIGVTLLLCIPANIIIRHLTDISNLARLPWQGGAALVVISMALTMIAGLIPSRIAAKKNPVEALRSE
ncbi:MAG: ABC transporter ATP-binding protein/permease, partial [Clostridia bacterium]|nr:ABC transporter ATP-binding protein/permease [Clostridia bacterium]